MYLHYYIISRNQIGLLCVSRFDLTYGEHTGVQTHCRSRERNLWDANPCHFQGYTFAKIERQYRSRRTKLLSEREQERERRGGGGREGESEGGNK